MQPPKTADDLLKLVERAHLLDHARMDAVRKKIAEAEHPPEDPGTLANLMVKQHLLTRFQADQLVLGRSKGFWVKKYKIMEQVGIGGMARVFLAEHAIMRRKVALKILPTSKCADPASLARFLREARAVASLNHPNVIRAYDIDQEGDFYYIVLEYVEGQTVAQRVESAGPIPWSAACDYIYQAAAGLEHILNGGIIHRDIKPANILIDKTGLIKLVDLGLAVFFEEKEKDPLTIRYDQNTLGTADYLAPEQAIDSHNVDGRADIYSLGATFCYMLTGQPPFPEGTVAEKLDAHIHQAPVSVRERVHGIPEQLELIVQRMLAKKPEDRYESMTELRSVLRRFLSTDSVSAQLSGTFAVLNGAASDSTDDLSHPNEFHLNPSDSGKQQRRKASDSGPQKHPAAVQPHPSAKNSDIRKLATNAGVRPHTARSPSSRTSAMQTESESDSDSDSVDDIEVDEASDWKSALLSKTTLLGAVAVALLVVLGVIVYVNFLA